MVPGISGIPGALVRLPLAGIVAGHYQRAVHLTVVDGDGPYAVSLLRERDYMTAYDLLVSDQWWSRLAAYPDGAPITLLPAPGEGPATAEPLPDARGLPEDVVAARPVALPVVDEAIARPLAAALLECCRESGLVALLAQPSDGDDIFVRRARQEARLLNLVGLGRGLTPSGDDLVAGWYSVTGVTTAAASALREVSRRTTPPGATVLRLAAAARPAPWHRRALEALAAGDVAAAVGEAQRHGASSGLDTLTGIALGLMRRDRGRDPRGGLVSGEDSDDAFDVLVDTDTGEK